MGTILYPSAGYIADISKNVGPGAINSREKEYLRDLAKCEPYTNKFNSNMIRAYIRKTLEVTKDCVLEIIFKDTFTIEHEPERLKTWIKITREEIEKIW